MLLSSPRPSLLPPLPACRHPSGSVLVSYPLPLGDLISSCFSCQPLTEALVITGLSSQVSYALFSLSARAIGSFIHSFNIFCMSAVGCGHPVGAQVAGHRESPVMTVRNCSFALLRLLPAHLLPARPGLSPGLRRDKWHEVPTFGKLAFFRGSWTFRA